MILGNSWKEFDNIKVLHPTGNYWELHAINDTSGNIGWMVHSGNIDHPEDANCKPVPKFFPYIGVKDTNCQSAYDFSEGLLSALSDRDTIVYIL